MKTEKACRNIFHYYSIIPFKEFCYKTYAKQLISITIKVYYQCTKQSTRQYFSYVIKMHFSFLLTYILNYDKILVIKKERF